MKILFAVPAYHPNHHGMVAGLAAAGHEVAFLVREAHAIDIRAEGVEVVVLGQRPASPRPTARPRGLVPAFRSAFGVLRRMRPDLVVARNADSTSYAVYLACRLLGIRYLLYVQSRSGYESLSPGRRLRLRLGLWPRHTINSACVAPTDDAPGKTFDFVPFAVEHVGPATTEHPERPPLRILAVAKLDQARKNLVPLVRHLAPLLRDGRVRLTLAGLRGTPERPPYVELLAEIERRQVGGRVDLLENLPYADSRALYARHHLFVLASSQEPAAVSPAEAMAAGLPVICGSDNGTNYLVDPGETGFVFADGDFAEMTARIAYFLDNPRELARMGANGRRSIETTYSPDAYARRLLAVVARRFGPDA